MRAKVRNDFRPDMLSAVHADRVAQDFLFLMGVKWHMEQEFCPLVHLPPVKERIGMLALPRASLCIICDCKHEMLIGSVESVATGHLKKKG